MRIELEVEEAELEGLLSVLRIEHFRNIHPHLKQALERQLALRLQRSLVVTKPFVK